MIQEISINIKKDGLTHIMQIDTDIEINLPYILAEAFAEVIRLTSANPNIVIEQLVFKYGLPESMQIVGDSENENNKMIWHDTSEEPKLNQWYIAQTGDNSFDTFRKSIDNNEDWIKWSNGFKIKRWAYINDLLPKGGE